jgi:hypothetical protein
MAKHTVTFLHQLGCCFITLQTGNLKTSSNAGLLRETGTFARLTLDEWELKKFVVPE